MDNGQTPAFNILLRRARRAAGFTQDEVAARAGVSVRTISDLERGVNHAPHTDTVALLAEALSLRGAVGDAFVAAARRSHAPKLPAPLAGAGHGGRTPFVGRQRELALLDHHLAGQGPPLLVLAGEPGIGKSRLLQAVAAQPKGQGLAVLEGGCQRRGGQEPYAPLLAALKGHLRRQTPRQRRALLRGCAWLVRLLPELADEPIDPLPARALQPDQERRLMFEAVARFLTNVAEQEIDCHVVLLLDDLQWAGPDALDLLTTLARSAADISLRIIGAYRDSEIGPRDLLSVMLADLAHAGLAACHILSPLAPREAHELLVALRESNAQEGNEDATRRDRLVRRTGGVPFFLISYAQAMHGVAAGAEAPPDGGEQAIPWTVAHTIQQRVAALPGPARDVLHAAAVVGRVVEPALLTAATAHTERDVLTALDVALRARLLQEEGRTYRFAHDIIREVIEADLGAMPRIALYRRVAAALEQYAGQQFAPERLAYYYTQGDVLDKAALYLELVGDRARQGYANTAAEAYYHDASSQLNALGRLAEAARVLEKQGAMQRMLGRHDEAMATLERAADIHSASGDLDSTARALAETWLLHAESGTAEVGARRFKIVLDLLETRGGPSTGLAMLYSAQVNLLFTIGDNPGLAHAARRALELAGTTGDAEVLAEAKFKHGLALSSVVGSVEEGLQAYHEATRLGEAAGGMTNLAGWHNVVADIHMSRGEFEQCRRALARSHAVAEQQDNLLRREIARVAHGCLARYAGDWIQADADFSQALENSRQLGAVRQIHSALNNLGHVCLLRGDWDDAIRHLQEAEALAQRSHLFGGQRSVAILIAERDLREGRARDACARLAPLLDRPGSQEVTVTPLLVCMAWATLELGEPREAAQLVARAVDRLRADNLRLFLVDALRVQALVAARQSRWLEAEQALEEGLHLARAIPYPYAEARLTYVYGEMHMLQGYHAQARERASRALALFQQVGARKDSEQAEQLLSILG